jgi:molybdate transport system ATP-binding protein
MSRLEARFELQLAEFSLAAEFDLPAHGASAIFGPSGAGKSTLLRCIAGLTRSPGGYLRLGDELLQDDAAGIFVPPYARRFGFVFQEPRLFSHLSVRGNLEFGYQRVAAGMRTIEWQQVVALLALQPLLARSVEHLSLGEQQRVAIGRALLSSPRLLLLDEPLASLDEQRKQEILPYIQRLGSELQLPLLYVSHSLTEILPLAQTLLLMSQGRVVASGPLLEVCSDLRWAASLGALAGAVLEAQVVAHEREFGLTRLDLHGQSLYVPLQHQDIGSTLRVQVLARNVTLTLQPPASLTSVLNVLRATVVEIAEGAADQYAVQVKLDVGAPLLASISRKSLHSLALAPGQQLYVMIKAVSLG